MQITAVIYDFQHFVALYQGLLMTDKELTKALGTEGIVKVCLFVESTHDLVR